MQASLYLHKRLYFICARKGCSETAHLHKPLLTFTNVLTLCARGKAMVRLHICASSYLPSLTFLIYVCQQWLHCDCTNAQAPINIHLRPFFMCVSSSYGETVHLRKLLLTFINVHTLCVRAMITLRLHICASSS